MHCIDYRIGPEEFKKRQNLFINAPSPFISSIFIEHRIAELSYTPVSAPLSSEAPSTKIIDISRYKGHPANTLLGKYKDDRTHFNHWLLANRVMTTANSSTATRDSLFDPPNLKTIPFHIERGGIIYSISQTEGDFYGVALEMYYNSIFLKLTQQKSRSETVEVSELIEILLSHSKIEAEKAGGILYQNRLTTSLIAPYKKTITGLAIASRCAKPLTSLIEITAGKKSIQWLEQKAPILSIRRRFTRYLALNIVSAIHTPQPARATQKTIELYNRFLDKLISYTESKIVSIQKHEELFATDEKPLKIYYESIKDQLENLKRLPKTIYNGTTLNRITSILIGTLGGNKEAYIVQQIQNIILSELIHPILQKAREESLIFGYCKFLEPAIDAALLYTLPLPDSLNTTLQIIQNLKLFETIASPVVTFFKSTEILSKYHSLAQNIYAVLERNKQISSLISEASSKSAVEETDLKEFLYLAISALLGALPSNFYPYIESLFGNERLMNTYIDLYVKAIEIALNKKSSASHHSLPASTTYNIAEEAKKRAQSIIESSMIKIEQLQSIQSKPLILDISKLPQRTIVMLALTFLYMQVAFMSQMTCTAQFR